MSTAVLVVNAGSSSIKFALFPAQAPQCISAYYRGEAEMVGAGARFSVAARDGKIVAEHECSGRFFHRGAIDAILEWAGQHVADCDIVAAGHRVVHGGENFSGPVRITPAVIAELERLIPLARTHEPHEVAAIKVLAEIRPNVPQVACFDTAFHATQPTLAQMLAIPRDIAAAGVKRYGFHGLSYEYISGRLPALLGAAAEGRVVVAHLGSGSSMCALRNRRSVATTMGFSTLDGLMMGTRSGALDPGVLLYLVEERGMTVKQVSDLLYHRSGLLGVSGISADMRMLLASDHPHAREAVDLYVYRAVRELGSLVAALAGLDALVFTGGIGEHAAAVRAAICLQLRWLGAELDEAANQGDQTVISAAASRVKVLVIPTDEELVIARHTLELLAQQ